MTKKKAAHVETTDEADPMAGATVTRETLDGTPTRVLTFLYAVGTVPPIRTALASRGYTNDDHDEGWRLLHAASGFDGSSKGAGTIGVASDPAVRDATAQLDAADEDIFRLVRAALTRQHPDAAKFVLADLGPSQGPASVLGIQELLARLDELEDGADRKKTRKADHDALDTLSKRGIDKAERARLASLVKKAQSTTPIVVDHTGDAAREAEHVKALIALRSWFEDWGETGRVAVKRRDYLIRMGFATRKTPTRPAPPSPSPAPVPAPPAPTPVDGAPGAPSIAPMDQKA